MNKIVIKDILDLALHELTDLRYNIGNEEKFQEFLKRQDFYYNGIYVGHSLNDYLAEAIYHRMTAKERKEFEEWRKAHFSRITSPIEHGDRGEYYDYVECFDGKIYAVCDEQGNYAGGHTATMTFGGRNEIANQILHFKMESSLPRQKKLYEQIKHTPIITEDEYLQLKEQRQKWPKDFDYYLWFD